MPAFTEVMNISAFLSNEIFKYMSDVWIERESSKISPIEI